MNQEDTFITEKDIQEAKDKEFPIPDDGRSLECACGASGFELGARWAVSEMKSRLLNTKFGEEKTKEHSHIKINPIANCSCPDSLMSKSDSSESSLDMLCFGMLDKFMDDLCDDYGPIPVMNYLTETLNYNREEAETIVGLLRKHLKTKVFY